MIPHFALAWTLSLLVTSPTAQQSQLQTFKIVRIAKGLEHPWSVAFLPDGRFVVTERKGTLRLISREGIVDPEPIAGLPAISAGGQGGLLDVVLHPDFVANGWLYLSYVAGKDGKISTELMRATLVGRRLEKSQVLFRMEHKSSARHHFGGRIAFGPKGHLFLTLGDRGEDERAQRQNDHAGKIVRLLDDGRIPPDNPFVGKAPARPEIFSLGHRNVQGAAIHPTTGELWTHEHGPQGGDEVNLVRAGKNYGWPVITYGVNYGWGTPIGEGTHKAGLEQPVHTWVPSIAPSGMMFYTGDKFPRWRGNLFVGALKFQLLARLELKGNAVAKEERLLTEQLGRIRDVRQGPDGYIYLLTDEANGELVRLEPL